MATITEAMMATRLAELLDEDMECEEETHDDKGVHDDGPGVWYVTMHCKWCGDTATELYCNKFYELIRELPDDWVIDHGCGKTVLAGEALVNSVRRNGKKA